MKKLAVTIPLLIVLIKANVLGQILDIQFNSLNNYQFNINNIWDLTIVNSSREISATLIAEIKAEDQRQIFWSETRPFLITSGISRITSASITVVRMEYGINTDADYLSQTGFLPEGKYFFEARVLANNSEGKILGSYSTYLNVQPIVPPVLVSPFNKENINTLSPILTWLPPAPVSQRYLNYALKVVELLGDESPASAIKTNIPLIDERDLKKASFIIREGSSLLQYDHHYAWQITAYLQDKYVATTEVWQFTPVKNKPISNSVPGLSYWILKEDLDGGYNLTDDTLRVSYKNTTQETQLNYQIINLNNPGKKVSELPPIPVKYGINNIDIVLKKLKGLKYNESYLFLVTDSKKREYKMHFVYGNPKKRDWNNESKRSAERTR